MKCTHEQIVQYDVGDAGNGDEIHGMPGIAKAAENRADDVVGGDKGNTEKADGQVPDGPRHSFVRSGHYRNNGINHQQQGGGHNDCNNHKKSDGIPDALLRLHAVTPAYCLRNAHSGSHGESDDDDGQHMHYL